MFTTENPSGPSCSLNSKASSDLPFCHEHQTQSSNFSIRDYVSKSRSQDIRIHWPFSQPPLKLCLDNGIQHLLPPFESPTLVKAHLLKREAESEQLFMRYENELNRKESEISLRPVSDLMASNVCPVCKSFTSYSNTTLNAHIDQCLSCNQSNVVRDFAQVSKPRVKLRKKRLMVDIYATARHYTLEDLDRRNGTNWAANYLSLVEPAAKSIELETKRTKFAPNASEGDVGDIYVDSNGTKLLILSKVNDSAPLVSRKHSRLNKDGKEFKEGRSCLSEKEKSTKPSYSTFLNETDNINISMIEEGGEMTGACQDNEVSQLRLLNAYDPIKNSERPILGHWVCSKRSELSRRRGNKAINKVSKKTIGNSRKLLPKHTQPSLFHSSAKQNKRMDSLSGNAKKMDSVKMRAPQPSSLNSKFLLRGDSFNEVRHPSFSRSASSSLETRKVNKRENFITPTKFRKRKLILGCSELQRGEEYNNVNGGRKATGVLKAKETSNIEQSSLSENIGKESLVMEDSTKSFMTDTPISDTNLGSTQEEHADSISRNEIQIVPLNQRSTRGQEENLGDIISNEDNQDVQISDCQVGPAMDQVGFRTDISSFQESNPRFSYNGEMSHENAQKNSLATSLIVETNKDDYLIVDTETSGSPVSTISAISLASSTDENFRQSEERLSSMTARKDDNVGEPSCSCSESLSQQLQFSKQSIKDTASYSFINAPILSPKVLESNTNPILRLMGKDLVVTKQESMPLPSNLAFHSDYSSDAKFISFISYNTQSHHIRNNLNSSAQCRMDRQHHPKPTVPSYQSRDLVVIDDDSNELVTEIGASFTTLPRTVQNPNLMAPQMPFACFPLQNSYASRGVITPSQRQNSEGLSVFSSPSSLYFSQTLR